MIIDFMEKLFNAEYGAVGEIFLGVAWLLFWVAILTIPFVWFPLGIDWWHGEIK